MITKLYRNNFYKHLFNLCPCVKNVLVESRIKFLRLSSTDTKVKLSSSMSLSKYLNAAISFKGPISVSEYMKEALTNPIHGYYMNKNMLGPRGDFITSPEINQLFGEIVAVWILNEWKKIYGRTPLYLIELGPGKGTMISDILRVFKTLNVLEGVSCHLVEVSPELSRLQAERLKVKLDKNTDFTSQCSQKGITENGVTVYWYSHLKSIPPEFSVIIAHEFFDALPIHKFKKTKDGWREVLIAPDFNDKEGKKFNYVLARGATLNTKMFVKGVGLSDNKISALFDEDMSSGTDKEFEQDEVNNWPFPSRGNFSSSDESELEDNDGDDTMDTNMVQIMIQESETRDEIEVSPQSGIVMNELAVRLEQYGGFALIADYGHNGELTDTFRAFKSHKQHDPLLEPGSADLTADVDFSYLKENTLNKLISFGPVTQREFLMRLHIDVRLKMLLHNCKDEKICKTIINGYKLMMDPNEMGSRFKFMSFFPEVLESHLKQFPVAGFTD